MALDGTVRPLEVRHKGVLLGVRGRGIRGLPTYREQTVTLPPGAALVLYTDGLTDRRTRADGDGHYTEAEAVAMLRDALLAAPAVAPTRSPRPPRTPCPATSTTTWRSWCSAPRPMISPSFERSFPAEPIMVSEARRLAQATFAAWDMHPDQADLALLLVSEVVTNAVLHASVTPSPAGRRFDLELDPLADVRRPAVNVGALTPAGGFPVAPRTTPRSYRPREFTLRLRRGAESVWVEVFDPDLRLPRLRTARATDEGGRGPVPGRAAGHPLGLAPDPGGQGGLVRDPARRQDPLAVTGVVWWEIEAPAPEAFQAF